MKQITLLTILSFLINTSNSSAQTWELNGTGNLAGSQGTIPLIRYSDYSDRFYVLSLDTVTSDNYSIDTLTLSGTTWGSYEDSTDARSFITEDNGNLTFVRLELGSLQLFSTDENGQMQWTENSTGLPTFGALPYSMNLFKGINDDYYIAYSEDLATTNIYKFQNSTWTALGDYGVKIEFLSNGEPVIMKSFPNNTHTFSSYDGANWTVFDSISFGGLTFPFTISEDFCISSQDSIYFAKSFPLNAVEHELRFYNIDSYAATLIWTSSTAMNSPVLNAKVIVDKLDNPHVFYHMCDLGMNWYYHRAFDASLQTITGGGMFFTGLPHEYTRAYTVVVDELNCINTAVAYHSNWPQQLDPDTLKVETMKYCTCDYLASQDSLYITGLGTTLTSNVIDHATFQWLDCNNNYSPIIGATNATFDVPGNGSYALIIYQNGCIDTSECFVMTGIGIDEYDLNSNVQFYPNPTTDQVKVTISDGENVIVEITDLTGKTMIEKMQLSNGESIDMTQLSSGTYFIQVTTKSNHGTIPIVKL